MLRKLCLRTCLKSMLIPAAELNAHPSLKGITIELHIAVLLLTVCMFYVHHLPDLEFSRLESWSRDPFLQVLVSVLVLDIEVLVLVLDKQVLNPSLPSTLYVALCSVYVGRSCRSTQRGRVDEAESQDNHS